MCGIGTNYTHLQENTHISLTQSKTDCFPSKSKKILTEKVIWSSNSEGSSIGHSYNKVHFNIYLH